MRFALRPVQLLALATVAFAGTSAGAQSKAASSGAKDFAVSIPVALYGESVARLEANLAGMASVAAEINVKRRYEDYSEKHVEETGESLVSGARGALLLVSRYTDSFRLAGWYWSLGLGWREAQADWTTRADPSDRQADFALVDETGSFHHRATMAGTTGHMRGGYRYVGEEWPMMIGAYAGARHYQADVKDAKLDPEARTETGAAYTAMTERERERLKRRFMTQPELAIELGFIF